MLVQLGPAFFRRVTFGRRRKRLKGGFTVFYFERASTVVPAA